MSGKRVKSIRRRRVCLLAVALFAGQVTIGLPAATPVLPVLPVSEDGACPAAIAPESFTDEATLRAWHDVMDRHGERATASPAHTQFVDWLERELRLVPGLDLSDLPETIERQLETGAGLTVRAGSGPAEHLPVARAVPYSRPAPAGAVGALVDVPGDEAIADHDVAGKVVLRDVPTGSIPLPVFLAVAYYVHDPGLTFDWTGEYERGWVGAVQLLDDLHQAEQGGAAGVLFVHGFPREQVEGDYLPYHGDHWQVPAVYLGADEGARLRTLLATHDRVEARVTVRAARATADTRSLIATLPGQSEERIVITSHTDGTNAVWDNGPLAMLALARYYAALPIDCRPRTIEFVFTTAHLYLTHAGAVRYAEILDRAYDEGTVALVVVLEHFGAQEFAAVEREDGAPGRRLVSTGESELLATFVSESPVLVGHVADQIVRHDLRRTFLLRGADAPEPRFPPHRSYGGEGGPYRERIVPTVAAITGAWNLFSPAFDTDAILDVELMRRQTIAFGDLVIAVGDVPREVLAGADNAYRPGRDLLGSEPLDDVVPEAVPAGTTGVSGVGGDLTGGGGELWFCSLHELAGFASEASP